ncbi:flocculation protein FLO11-like [Nasonia vitripennis]|uniref:Uncharacterized protein n=1 Tax=Nasonia vitripennis TaxID=7425 RepID=A0A7M7H1X6_NASVI|nr:flocculation protein FLO11-like [Nasonia vitripennis]
MDWLPTLLALLLLGGLVCRADAAALESSTIPAEPEDPETSTVPITSLRMYHFEPPVKRRSFKPAPSPKPAEEEPSNRTLELVQPRSGKLLLPVPPSHCYLNETKADDEEIVGWLAALPADRKLRLLKALGYDPANCTRPRRRCSKKTPPALAKLPTTTPKAAEEPPATTTSTSTTTSTTPAPSTSTSTTTTTTTLTPETEELTTTSSTTSTTEFAPRRRMLTPTTTTTTPGSSASTSSSTTTTTTVAPPPKKEKSKCRKKKKAAAKKLKETKE